jgi:hypothetical protein
MKRVALWSCSLVLALLFQAGCGKSNSGPLSEEEQANFNRPLTAAEKTKWDDYVRKNSKAPTQ